MAKSSSSKKTTKSRQRKQKSPPGEKRRSTSLANERKAIEEMARRTERMHHEIMQRGEEMASASITPLERFAAMAATAPYEIMRQWVPVWTRWANAMVAPVTRK